MLYKNYITVREEPQNFYSFNISSKQVVFIRPKLPRIDSCAHQERPLKLPLSADDEADLFASYGNFKWQIDDRLTVENGIAGRR